MLVSPFTFYRGAAAIMASDLATVPSSGIRVQLCGDAHLSNFGGFASPERDLLFDINDFDETLPGPWEWDVKRLTASLVIAGRERGFGRKECRAIVVDAVGEYRTAMASFAGMRDLDVWYARLDESEMIGRLRQGASSERFAKLTHQVDGQVKIVSDPPLIVPIEEVMSDRDAVEFREALELILRSYRRTLPGDRRHLLDGFRLQHVARKVVGVGSVGTRAWIALFFGRDQRDPLFLQFKEAQESVLAPYAGKSEFANAGQRVVEGQRLMQAAGDIMLGWTRAEGPDGIERDFYVRQLWDWKVSADVDTMNATTLRQYGRACGWALARAHARSGDRIAIAAYLGGGDRFDQAVARFSEAYADQNERDYAAVVAAVADGRLEATEGV